MMFRFFTLLVCVLTGVSLNWPVGDGSTGSITRTLLTSFGDNNPQWDNLESDSCNFHIGIDIPPCNGEYEVRAAAGGYFSEIFYDTLTKQYFVVIVDDYYTSEYGWGYQHLTEPDSANVAWKKGEYIPVNGLIAEMSTQNTNNPHLHFHWVPRNGVTMGGSAVNPLDSLPNSELLTWVWNQYFPSYPKWTDFVMFIEDMPISSWPQSHSQLNVLDPTSIRGSVDILYGYCLEAIGSIGFQSVCSVNAQTIKWSVLPTGWSNADTALTMYSAEFSEQLGAFPEDNEKYRLHYFRLMDYEQIGVDTVPIGRVVCASNGSLNGFAGIQTIQENCWKTNAGCSDSISIVPENALYADGPYKIIIESMAHDSTYHVYTDSLIVDNYLPYVEHVQVYQLNPEVLMYDAHWVTSMDFTTRELEDSTYGYLSDSIINPVQVKIGVYEPLDPNDMPDIWLSGAWGGETRWHSYELGPLYLFHPLNAHNPDYSSTDALYYYTYQTNLGLDGYYGDLKLNISGGRDLSGNPLDSDPSSVTPPTDKGEEEKGVDSSYQWDCCYPDFERHMAPPNTVWGYWSLGLSSGKISVPLNQAQSNSCFWTKWNTGLGCQFSCCPSQQGFWMVSTTPLSHFVVRIVDFTGTDIKTCTVPTMFPTDPDSSVFTTQVSSVIFTLNLLSGIGMGDYCWIPVDNIIIKPYGTEIDEDIQVPSYSFPQVFCITADGRRKCYNLPSGEDATITELIHYPGDENKVIVKYSVNSQNFTRVLNPPLLEILESSVQERNVNSASEALPASTVSFSFDVLQNPASHELSVLVSVANRGEISLDLYDVAGRHVSNVMTSEVQSGVHEFTSEIHLPDGVYFCRLVSNEGEITRKIVVTQ
ncbi:hypothetical protein CSA37_08525 [Candidatus Fermentibacteria bacterium]|nr:MAG: hypothetical protein CSA37_08525 [Candidatus Fermentibacteria bacterium]